MLKASSKLDSSTKSHSNLQFLTIFIGGKTVLNSSAMWPSADGYCISWSLRENSIVVRHVYRSQTNKVKVLSVKSILRDSFLEC